MLKYRTETLSIIVNVACAFLVSALPQNSYADIFSDHARRAKEGLLANISRLDTPPGTIIASPSRQDPDYYFHWVRDGALVIDVVQGMIERNYKSSTHDLKQTVKDFVFVTLSQQENSVLELGEPKYEVNTRPFLGPWARPQNDGPGLRATTLIRFAKNLMAEGEEEFVRRYLYRAEPDSDGVYRSAIKRDLEYVARVWQNDCFDIWEEIKGDHFYTRLAMYNALATGADFALTMNDIGASSWYRMQAEALRAKIEQHYTRHNYIIENLNRTDGITYKYSGLDIASILALLHNKGPHQVLEFNSHKVLETAIRLEVGFEQIYALNRYKIEGHAPGIGRYFEDTYYGGNPWFLTTLALAEYYYTLAANIKGQTSTMNLEKGDMFMRRALRHISHEGHMSEQFDRDTGHMKSARDLTWSYAAYLTAYWAREAVVKK